jgi:hypothetical protein
MSNVSHDDIFRFSLGFLIALRTHSFSKIFPPNTKLIWSL